MKDTPQDFDTIYEEHKLLVYNLALHYCQNITSAEEITQDVFVKYFKNPEKFRGESQLSTWFYRVTINTSIDFLRKKKRNAFLGFLDLNSVYEPSHFDHPGVTIEDQEATERIFKAINTLPLKQRTALILSKLEEKKQEEVAEIMNTTRKAVESLVQRAKKNIEIFLANEGF